MDSTDRKILNILQSDARTPNAELARQVGMAPSAVLERVRKLEDRGVIRGYEARLDPKVLDLGLLAFVQVRTSERVGHPETSLRLKEIPEVQEVHHVAGEDCFLIKVRVANTDALQALLRDRIGAIPTVRSTNTTIVLQTVKESATLPVENG
jgi:Lrp/AsnC family transcriptional regulator, leucine-responsive regulatory protein